MLVIAVLTGQLQLRLTQSALAVGSILARCADSLLQLALLIQQGTTLLGELILAADDFLQLGHLFLTLPLQLLLPLRRLTTVP